MMNTIVLSSLQGEEEEEEVDLEEEDDEYDCVE